MNTLEITNSLKKPEKEGTSVDHSLPLISQFLLGFQCGKLNSAISFKLNK